MIIAIALGTLVLYFFTSIYIFSRNLLELNLTTSKMIQDVKEAFPSLETLRRAESQLETHPEQLKRRLHILHAYFFIFMEIARSQEAKNHVLWIIQNASKDNTVNWLELGSHFADGGTEAKNAIEAWKRIIELNPNNKIILRNAADFSFNIDSDFAIACDKKLAEISPLDPKPLENLTTHLSRAARNNDIDSKKSIFQEAFKISQRRFKMPWNHNVYLALEIIQKGLFKYFFVDFISRFLLIAMAKCHLLPMPFISISPLYEGITVAYESDNFIEMRVWAGILSRYLDKYEKSMYQPHLLRPYEILARIAIYDRDKDQLTKYLTKLKTLKFGSTLVFAQNEERLLLEMKAANLSDLVLAYISDRSNGYISNESLIEKMK